MVSAESEKTSARKTYFNLSVFEFLTFLRRGVFYTFMINYLFTLMGTVTSTAALGTLNMVASALGQNLLWGKICDRRKIRTTLIVAGETIAAFAYVHRVSGAHEFYQHRIPILGRSNDNLRPLYP